MYTCAQSSPQLSTRQHKRKLVLFTSTHMQLLPCPEPKANGFGFEVHLQAIPRPARFGHQAKDIRELLRLRLLPLLLLLAAAAAAAAVVVVVVVVVVVARRGRISRQSTPASYYDYDCRRWCYC